MAPPETVFVDPSNATEVDVVFVHGLRGDKIKTWSKGDVCWPRDYLKDEIETARIITWGYDSSVINPVRSAAQESIFSHSENLLSDLARLRKRVPSERPVIFVAHSLGGLVVKEALIRSSEYHHNKQNARLGAIGQATKGIVFMGTPHRGSSPAKLAGLVANIARVAFRQHPNERLIHALTQDSDLLEHNRRSFASISVDLPIGSFFEGKGFLTMGLIVEQYSASLDTFKETVGTIPENHMDMCKFASKEDIGYVRVADRIEELCSAAIGVLRQGTANQSPVGAVPAAPTPAHLLLEQSEDERGASGSRSNWHGSISEIQQEEDLVRDNWY
jgi:pimeloyl-ACP methyl ester carboxylesterase